MALSNLQPNWDIYEAVILLDGYLEILKTNQAKSQIVKRVSSDLRKMAVNRGIVIDNTFRNENGIQLQMQSMESAYEGKKISIPSTKLFESAVALYRTDRAAYIKILNKARSMIAAKQDNKGCFLTWAAGAFPPRRYKWMEENILRIERFACASKLLSGSIFDVTDITKLKEICNSARKNKIYYVKNKKFITYILDDFEAYIQYCSRLQKQAGTVADSGRLLPGPSADEHGDRRRLEYVDPTNDITETNIYPVYIPRSTACEDRFYNYLKNTAKLSGNSCESYITSIRSAERYAFVNGITSHRLFSEDKDEIIAAAKELYGNPIFVKYNEQKHNRFGIAINHLLRSIGSDASIMTGNVPAGKNDTNVSTNEGSGIAEILKKHYEYGFKYDSYRELMRFRMFAEDNGVAIPKEDEALKNLILSAGTVIDNKVFCKDEDITRELHRIVDDAASSGAGVLYYESLFDNKQEWLESHIITSPEMLKTYLQNNISGYSFSKKFMVKGNRLSEKEAVTNETIRVWGTHPTESVYSLHDRLPYIPLKNIWRVISGNDMFVLAAEGEYLLIDRLNITEDEEKAILKFVDSAYEKNGFASLGKIPLGGIEEENYELTQATILNAIYKKVLSDKYILNGKILTRGSFELDAITLLKQYIKGKDECTLNEVEDKVIELTGTTNRQYAFQGLYDEMVRVDKDHFVADRFTDFHTDEIDSVLAGFVTNDFRAIKDVTTFAMFPLCGQSWNHYLLESYCYKYSRRFSLHVLNFNDKNAGVIAKKELDKKYDEMMAIALARENVELSPEAAGQYLFDSGYLAKRKYSKLPEITQMASELREKR